MCGCADMQMRRSFCFGNRCPVSAIGHRRRKFLDIRAGVGFNDLYVYGKIIGYINLVLIPEYFIQLKCVRAVVLPADAEADDQLQGFG